MNLQGWVTHLYIVIICTHPGPIQLFVRINMPPLNLTNVLMFTPVSDVPISWSTAQSMTVLCMSLLMQQYKCFSASAVSQYIWNHLTFCTVMERQYCLTTHLCICRSLNITCTLLQPSHWAQKYTVSCGTLCWLWRKVGWRLFYWRSEWDRVERAFCSACCNFCLIVKVWCSELLKNSSKQVPLSNKLFVWLTPGQHWQSYL